eukprot:2368799-Amphidinium_carterae.1
MAAACGSRDGSLEPEKGPTKRHASRGPPPMPIPLSTATVVFSLLTIFQLSFQVTLRTTTPTRSVAFKFPEDSEPLQTHNSKQSRKAYAIMRGTPINTWYLLQVAG